MANALPLLFSLLLVSESCIISSIGTHVRGVIIECGGYLNACVAAIVYDMDFNTFVSNQYHRGCALYKRVSAIFPENTNTPSPKIRGASSFETWFTPASQASTSLAVSTRKRLTIASAGHSPAKSILQATPQCRQRDTPSQ